MNTHLLRSLLPLCLALAGTALPSHAADKSTAKAHPVESVSPACGVTISRGDTHSDVLFLLGNPQRRITQDVWLYPGFNGGRDHAEGDDCTVLMITFEKGRIADLKLVNDRAEKVYAARLQSPSDKNVLVAGRKP